MDNRNNVILLVHTYVRTYTSNREKIQRVILPDNINKYSTILSKYLPIDPNTTNRC